MTSAKFPENGTLVPKHVRVGTNHELCFMICVLFYFILLNAYVG